MSINRVSRIALDGTTVTIAFGRATIACTKASYGDGLTTGTLSSMGSQSIDARTRGTYKTEQATVSMDSVIFREEMMPLMAVDGFGNEELSAILVSYGHPDLGFDSDALGEARFVGLAAAIENSEKALEVEFKIDFNQLYWGNNRITINQRDLTTPLPASKF